MMNYRIFLMAAMLFCLPFALMSCSDDDNGGDTFKDDTVTASPRNPNLLVGDGLTFKITSSLDKTACVYGAVLDKDDYSGRLEIPESIKYKGCEYAVTTIEADAFKNYKKLTAVNIPSSVVMIGKSAFSGCSGLKSIQVPNSVTAIGPATFSGCSGLTSATISNSVTIIEDGLFAACTNLTSLEIGRAVTTIGKEAFAGCTSVSSVLIPNSVTEIGNAAFEGCKLLTSFYGKYASDDHRCLIIDGLLHSFASAGVTSYTIPNSVTAINDYAFSGCTDLKSITIPNSVVTIGKSPFNGCSNLTSVKIGNSVTAIVDDMFKGCSNLTSVEMGSSVATIGKSAFEDCTSLTNVEIPDAVTEIGSWAFKGCSSLAAVKIGDSVTKIGPSAFRDCTSLTNVEIPDAVTEIGSWAFQNCDNLTSVVIGSSVAKIGTEAFEGCTKLAYVINFSDLDIWKGKTYFGYVGYYAKTIIPAKFKDGPFFYTILDTGETYLTQYLGTDSSVRIPEGITAIYDDAFVIRGLNVTSVELPSSVIELAGTTFAGCYNLKEITSLNTTPPSIDAYSLYDVDKSTCVIKVPASAVNAYKTAKCWKDFENIVGI